MVGNIIVRADASRKIGTGHIMRTLALAETLKEQGMKVFFLCIDIPRNLEIRLKKENMNVIKYQNIKIGSSEDAENTVKLAKSLKVKWIIADGYNFGTIFQKIIKAQGNKLLLFDDYRHSDYYYADLVINGGVHANKISYMNKNENTKVLLGPKYILLREEFLNKNQKRVVSISANKILVTLGGSDPTNQTAKVLKALKNIEEDFKAKIIIGPGYEAKVDLQNDNRIEFIKSVNDMASLIMWADIGISAGGITLLEMAFLGLPNLIIKTAKNQCATHLFSDKYQTSIYLGKAEEVTSEVIEREVKELQKNLSLRQKMSENGKKLIDGKGNQRILESLLSR